MAWQEYKQGKKTSWAYSTLALAYCLGKEIPLTGKEMGLSAVNLDFEYYMMVPGHGRIVLFSWAGHFESIAPWVSSPEQVTPKVEGTCAALGQWARHKSVRFQNRRTDAQMSTKSQSFWTFQAEAPGSKAESPPSMFATWK